MGSEPLAGKAIVLWIFWRSPATGCGRSCRSDLPDTETLLISRFHFAGNPYYIDLEILIEEGLLTKEICDGYDFGDNEHYVDYEKIYLSRFKVLKIAFENAKNRDLWMHRNIRSSSRTMPIGWMIMPCIWQ